MKNKLLAVLAAFGLVSSATAVEINKNLSIGGFIDGSYYDGDLASGQKTTDIDEVEVQFDVNVGNVSGSVHIDRTVAEEANLNIEQAHFTYSLENGVSFTFGRFGSALGFEREDPAGLYTYSRAYNQDFNLGNIDSKAIGQLAGDTYAGLNISYSADSFTAGVSIVEQDGNFGSTDDDLNFEFSASYTGFENLVVGGGYLIDNGLPGQERDVLNIHAAYTVGKALIAGEIISADDANTLRGEDAHLVLIDYDFTDKLGAAIRYSEYEMSSTQEGEKLTVAPNYAITDSLGAILEFSQIEEGGADRDELAVELTFTF